LLANPDLCRCPWHSSPPWPHNRGFGRYTRIPDFLKPRFRVVELAQKWLIGLEGIIFDGNGNTGRDILRALERRYPYGLEPFFGSRPGGRSYTNLHTACAAAWNPSILPSAMHSRLE